MQYTILSSTKKEKLYQFGMDLFRCFENIYNLVEKYKDKFGYIPHYFFVFFSSHLLVVNFVLFWQYQIQIKCNDLTAKNVIIFYTYISRINRVFFLKIKLFLVDFCRLLYRVYKLYEGACTLVHLKLEC